MRGEALRRTVGNEIITLLYVVKTADPGVCDLQALMARYEPKPSFLDFDLLSVFGKKD